MLERSSTLLEQSSQTVLDMEKRIDRQIAKTLKKKFWLTQVYHQAASFAALLSSNKMRIYLTRTNLAASGLRKWPFICEMSCHWNALRQWKPSCFKVFLHREVTNGAWIARLDPETKGTTALKFIVGTPLVKLKTITPLSCHRSQKLPLLLF